MHRAFTITLPADTNPHNLYTLMTAQTDAIPADGTLPFRVCHLMLESVLTSTDAIVIADTANSSGNGGIQLDAARRTYEKHTDGNNIDLTTYVLVPNAVSKKISVDIEAK